MHALSGLPIFLLPNSEKSKPAITKNRSLILQLYLDNSIKA